MRAPRHGFILFVLICVLLMLPPTASGRIVIDMPFIQPLQVPVSIPFLENISIGSTSQHIPTEYRNDGWEISNGDIIIERGQTLSLKNYSLFLNCTYNGQHKIEVRDGGALLIENCSISSLNGKYAFLFQVQKGGLLVMKNSSLSGCGFNGPGDGSKGLWLDSSGNTLASNNLSENYYGAVVEGNRCSILNNTITSCYCGLLIESAGTEVADNDIRDNQMGVDASHSGLIMISGNTIDDNLLYGLLLGGDGPVKLTGNDISGNGEGVILLNASTCLASENRLDGNGGHGLIIDRSHTISLSNMTITSNAWGLYINGTNDSSIHGVVSFYNAFDGVFVNNSNNVMFIDNNASYNGGYGYNITENNTRVTLNRRQNGAAWNYMGDYNAPPGALSIAEVSLLSLFIALVDKLIYLVDIQKVIVTNVFSGIVNPMREPLSKNLDRLSHRLLSMFHITRRGYSMAHVSAHMNVLFFHLINGKDIRGIVRSPAPAKLSSHEIVLQQIRFFDLLFRDRVMLFRNILYMAITTGVGIAVYTFQVWIGTYDLPYFLPLGLQFLVMFPIGLAVQGNVVGHVEKLDYDVRDEASIEMLRDSVFRQTAELEMLYGRKKVSDKKFKVQMKELSDAMKAVDQMDVRRHYLLFTPEGYDRAISGFESLLQKSPDEPLFLAGLAEAHAMLGRSLEMGGSNGKVHYQKALEAAEKASSLDGGSFEARQALAMSLLFNGQTERARRELAEAMRLRPVDAESYLLKAMMADSGEEQQRLYSKALSLNKDLRMVGLEIHPAPVLAAASIKS